MVVVSILGETDHGHDQNDRTEKAQKQAEGEKLEGLARGAELVLADELPALSVSRGVPGGQIDPQNADLDPEK